MKKSVVLYPGLAVSHFVSMMQLADVLLDAGYAVVVALIDPADKQDVAFAAVVRRVAASKPLVAFHKLPRIEDPPTVIHDAQFLLRYLDLVSRYDQLLHGFLCAMPLGSVQAVVVDASSSSGAVDVAKKLGIPAYSFYPTNASTVAVFLQLPTIRREDQPSFRELGDTPLNFHGVPPMPASHLVEQVLQDPESEVYKVMMDRFRRIPDGFLDRTNDRDLILKLWAPQVDALRHKATGAFVTHCGWNSVLEGITAGVPMLCWPLYAEQKMNKVFMVEEAGIGVEVAGLQQGLVKAGEVEDKVRMVLESEEGERLRAQVTALSKAAAAAWEDGGSSRVAFQRFLSDAEKLKSQAMRA